MIRISTVFLLFVSVFFISVQSSAQSFDLPIQLGVGIGGMNGNKEFDGNTDFQARLFVRHYYTESVRGEFGVGIGSISDWFYETHLFPFDYRILYSPEYYEQWSPYLYGGFGFVSYDVARIDYEHLPSWIVPKYKPDGISAYIPFGIGVEMIAEEGLGLDFNLGYNLAFTDDLNGSYADDPNDAYWTFLISMTINGTGYNRMNYRSTYSSDERRWDRGMTGPDSDGDGLSDDEEIMRYRTDPYNVDGDADGLRDSYEVLTFHSDPFRPDTDLDGLNDGDEVRTYFTDPLKKDTDGDGLDDREEAKVTHTNPLDPDTDRGGVKDGIEVAKNAHPLDASDDKFIALTEPDFATPTGKDLGRLSAKDLADARAKMALEGIVFRTGSADILPTSVPILERAYQTLREYPGIYVQIQGHTDNIGTASSNLDLSRRRASAVKWWLVTRGIDANRLTTKGFGYSRPIATNVSEAGRQRNRRIEFVVQ